jgi:hypothetical protein
MTRPPETDVAIGLDLADRSQALLQIVYFSRAQVSGRAEDIAETIRGILSVARTTNPALGITGALLFDGKHFAQVLEGPRGRVTDLLHHIQLDSRHSHISIVQEERVSERDFGGWAMAYVDDDEGHAIRLSPSADFDRVPDTPHGRTILDLLGFLVRNAGLSD